MEWFGVDRDQIANILPNAKNFPDEQLYKGDMLFGDKALYSFWEDTVALIFTFGTAAAFIAYTGFAYKTKRGFFNPDKDFKEVIAYHAHAHARTHSLRFCSDCSVVEIHANTHERIRAV